MKRIKTRDLCLCAMFAALMAVGAFVKIQLPFIPIPITFQVTFAILAGLLLGKKLGALSIAIYVIIGLIGVPVFTAGGGIGYVLNPNFGYLYGFILSAFAAGAVVEKQEKPSYIRILFAAFIGLLIAYILGIIHMYIICRFVTGNPMGVLVLLAANGWIFVKDFVLALISSYLAKRLIPLLKRGTVND